MTIHGKIFINGHTYHPDHIKDSKRYMLCNKNRPLGCRARAIILQNSRPNKVILCGQHNHPQDLNEFKVLQFLNVLKLYCTSGIDVPLKNAYERAAERYPEGAKMKPFNSIKGTMNRWKAKAHTKY